MDSGCKYLVWVVEIVKKSSQLRGIEIVDKRLIEGRGLSPYGIPYRNSQYDPKTVHICLRYVPDKIEVFYYGDRYSGIEVFSWGIFNKI